MATLVGDILYCNLFEVAHLVHKRRHNDEADGCDNTSHKKKSEEDAENATLEVTFLFEKNDNGIEHISKNPRHKERNEHRTQITENKIDSNDAYHNKQSAHETIEIYLFIHSLK